MKLLSKTAALLGLALAYAGSVSAATTIHISGATTYRACVHQAISHVLDAGFSFACDNANPYKQGAAIYSGTLNSAGHPAVIIKTYWTGSLAGVYDVAKPNVIVGHYPADGTTLTTQTGFSADGVPTFAGSFVLASGFATEDHAPEVALSDAFAASCAASIGSATVGGPDAQAAIAGADLVPAGAVAGPKGAVGLVAFQWVLGVTSATPLAITNITTQNALSLIQGGAIPLSMITGSPSDVTTYLCLVGRNEDSGTRINAHAEAQNGFGNPTVQLALDFGATSTSHQADGRQTGGPGSTVASFDLWPADAALNTELGVNWLLDGHSGYIGGGDVKAVLQSTNPAHLTTDGGTLADVSGIVSAQSIAGKFAYFIGYLGTSDAAVGGNAVQLSYNGVPFTEANVDNGKYSFWGYEHMFYLSSLGGDAKTAADAIADEIFSTDADVNNNNGGGTSVHGTSGNILQSGLLFNANVRVQKSVEGAVITSNF
ncbi:MAG: hypothetical protein WDN28_33210 [Chthoniobacter sp.]